MKIAIVGQARAGKDTVAHYLVDHYQFTEYKFSRGIHDVIDLIRGKTDEPKNRSDLQGVGQGLRKVLGDDIWVNYTLKLIKDNQLPQDNIVISDCRQQNERDILAGDGYLFIKVVSDRQTRIERMELEGDIFSETNLDHETERIPFDTDYTLNNNGTIEELYQQLDRLLEVLHTSKEWRDGTFN